MSSLKRIFKLLGKNSTPFFVLFVLALPFYFIEGFILSYVVEKCAESIELKSVELLFKTLITFFVAFFASVLASGVIKYFQVKIVNKLRIKLNADLLNQTFKCDLLEVEKYPKGHILSIMNNDIELTLEVLSSKLLMPFQLIAGGIGGIIYIASRSWILLLVVLVGSFLAIMVSIFVTPKVQKVAEEKLKSKTLLTNYFILFTESYMTIKNMRLFHIFKKDHAKLNNQMNDILIQEKKVMVLKDTLLMLSGELVTIFILIFGSILAFNGAIMISVVFGVVQMAGTVSNCFISIGKVITDIQPALIASKRVLEIYDIKTEKENQDKDFIHDDIVIKNLSFKYKDYLALKNVSLTIKKNSFVCIVGKNGSGKSTLMKILLALYHEYEGEVCINNKKISSLNLENYRKIFTYMPQDALILVDTIKNNIKLLNDTASDAEINQLIDDFELRNKIDSLELKLEEVLYNDSKNLSGGEKQRISIIRTLLNQSDILLLDEATSALDAINEDIVNKNIDRLKGQKTIIMITHKLSSCINADQIYVLKEGSLVENGTYEELLKKKGYFFELNNYK